MSVTVKVDEIPILSEELSDEREVKINILSQVIAFCLLLGLLGLGILIPNISNFSIFNISFRRWLVLGLLIILGRLVSYFIVKLILYLVKSNRFCRVRVFFFVVEEKKSLHRLFWSVIVFIVGFLIVYNPLEIRTKNRKSQKKVLILLGFMMIGCFAWLTVSLLLQLHKIKCLNDIYFDRLTRSILEHYVLRMLLSSPERGNHEMSKFNDLSKLNKKEVTARIVDKLMNMVREGSLPSIKELDHKDNPIESAVTKSILQNIFKLGFRSRQVENIKKFLSDQNILTINIFDGDEINEKALYFWVENVYKNRQTLVNDMKRTDMAIVKQHLVVRIAVGVILIFYTLYFLQDRNKHGRAPTASPVFL